MQGHTLNAHRILIADDHPSVARALHQLLSDIPDFAPLDVARGEDLIETATRTQPELILMDWALRGIRPEPTLQRLHKQLPNVRIIVMSAQLSDRERAIDAGADAFISKTDMAEEILAILRGQFDMSIRDNTDI